MTPWLLHHDNDVKEVVLSQHLVSCGTNQPIRKLESVQRTKVE